MHPPSIARASLFAIAVASGAAVLPIQSSAQDVVMRRPLPNGAGGGPTATPPPTPTPPPPGIPNSATGYHGWQPGCSQSAPTSACVSIGTDHDTVVSASECPATQDAAGEALAHARGYFGMQDGISAANAASACTTEPDSPKSYRVARSSCVGGNTRVACTQGYVNAAGDLTAQVAAPAYLCASQSDTPEFQSFVAGAGQPLATGGTFVRPSDVYSQMYGACTGGDPAPTTRKVTAGQCSRSGGYVCTVFDVAKSQSGTYSISKAMPADANLCYGNDNPSGPDAGYTGYIGDLGYYVPSGYGSPASWCANYDTFGASSECRTTVKQRPAGGYDISTGLDVNCYGLAPSPYNSSYIVQNLVDRSRCEAAAAPDAV